MNLSGYRDRKRYVLNDSNRTSNATITVELSLFLRDSDTNVINSGFYIYSTAMTCKLLSLHQAKSDPITEE